ncbi:MAG: VOC family protein [Pseudomonadota bacterium]
MSLPEAPTIQGILEASIYVDDLDKAEEFYGRVLGLSRIQRVAGRHVFFRAGTFVLLVFNPDQTALPPTNPALPVPPHGARGPGHVCLTLARPEIEQMRARLLAAEVEIEADFDWPNGARSLYFRDPAGNSVEFAESRLWD